jgi:hypothetical protein
MIPAIVVESAEVTLVVPVRARPYYVRTDDGAIGFREGDTVFWSSGRDIRTELAPEAVMALDRALLRLAEVVREWRL